MIRVLFLVCALSKVRGQLAPLIFAAPSAVSHQSRIDIRHTPGLISAPFIYSPIAVPNLDQPVLPVMKAERIFTPVALTFFHNLPLARALEHPISIDKLQEDNMEIDKKAEEELEGHKVIREELVILDPNVEEPNYEKVIVNNEEMVNPKETVA